MIDKELRDISKNLYGREVRLSKKVWGIVQSNFLKMALNSYATNEVIFTLKSQLDRFSVLVKVDKLIIPT